MTGSKHRRRRLVMTIVLAALAGAAPAAAAELPLGEKGLPETRERTVLAPGATYTRIVRGTTGDEYFVIDLGFTLDRGEAEASAAKLRAEGYDARVLTVDLTAPDARLPGPVAHLVRLGRFATAAEAQATQTTLVAAGYQRVRVDYTGDDGTPTTGPWRIHVLEVDPRRFRGRLAPILATDFVPERETVSSIDARTGALAVINGGYFVIGAGDGTPGDLAGLSILRDRLVSEAVNGRTDLLLARPNGRGTRVAALSTRLTAVASDGARRTVDGRNRKPGLIRSYGGVGGDLPTELPRHDFTCTDAAELIQYTADFGAATDATAELEAVLDARGRVEQLRAPGGAIPSDGSVLGGTGDGAQWLRDHGQPGNRVRVSVRVGQGLRRRHLPRRLGVVNGGPRLLAGGEPAISAAAEGFVRPDDPEFFYRFGIRRNPRTLAGVTRDGRVLLVAADGRSPGYANGLSFAEEAAVMAALGASSAVNLDGGGSTAMTVADELVTRPSDATGERPVGDAIALLP